MKEKVLIGAVAVLGLVVVAMGVKLVTSRRYGSPPPKVEKDLTHGGLGVTP